MADDSHLDSCYFVDGSVYNCPFCNRRHVTFQVINTFGFHWSKTKRCKGFLVRCNSCMGVSMHLSFADLPLVNIGSSGFRFQLADDTKKGFIDDLIFYSVPTSSFVVDERIPSQLRDLLTEAEGCLKSNFLTGASACARKLVYELAVDRNATGENYDDRIKSLKALHPQVDSVHFDTLLTIQQVTSTKVHENALDGWEASHLRLLLAALKEALHEIYVVPELRKDRRQAVLDLKEKLMPDTKAGGPAGDLRVSHDARAILAAPSNPQT